MQPQKNAITAVLVSFAMLGVAHAQAPVRITLDQAVDLAIAHNHALKATQTQIQQNQAQQVTAALRPNPNLTTDSLFIPIEPQNFNANIIANVTEFDAGSAICSSAGANGTGGSKPLATPPPKPAIRSPMPSGR